MLVETSRGYVVEFDRLVFVGCPRSQSRSNLTSAPNRDPLGERERVSRRRASSRDVLRTPYVVVPPLRAPSTLSPRNRTFFSIERHPPSVSACCAAYHLAESQFFNCSQCNYSHSILTHYL